MTPHVLRKLGEGQPDDILLALMSPKLGFREMVLSLKEEKSDPSGVEKVLKVLAKAVQSTFSPHNLLCLLQMILQTNFLMGPAPRMLNNVQMIQDVILVINCYQDKMPTQSLPIVFALLPQIHPRLARLYGDNVPPNIQSSIADIEEQATLIQKQFQRGDLQRDRGKAQEPDAPGDFRKLSVIPSSRDIQPEMKPFIRKNRVHGSYKNADEYLDVQFRLLREDCIRPLREGIKEYRRNKSRGENKRLQDIRVYKHARILEPYCGKRAVVHLIEFDVSDLKKVQWETSKRLISGSLLCFSKDDFKTALFGTIVDREVNDLRKGNLYVEFEGLNIQLLNSNPYEEYIMVESGAYFESYVHNLEGLKDFNSTTLPFQKYLLCNEDEIKVSAPRYLLNKPTTYDFSCVLGNKIKSHMYRSVNPLDLKAWPSKEEMGLDPSQYQAIQTAISKEYSVIQGPPGTGKTFIGLKICQVLLENKNVWLPNQQSRPILVVCYTNHALDQFLEGILEFMEPFDNRRRVPQLARLGGRTTSDNEKLQNCLLRNIKEKARIYGDIDGRIGRREIRDMIQDAKDNKDAIEGQIGDLSEQIEGARSSIIHENFLQHLMTPNHKMSLNLRPVPQGNSLIQHWLLENMQVVETATEVLDVQDKYDGEQQMEEEDNEFDYDDYGGEEEMAKRIPENFDIDKQRKLAHGQREVQHIESSKQRNNEEEWTQVKLRKIPELKKYLQSKNCMSEAQAYAVTDVWTLSIADRWRLYHYWMAKYCEDKMLRMRTLHGQFDVHARRLGELYDEEDYRVLSHCAVIGMTTTGAAKYRRLVKRIAPLIVIVEEAAEVLEAHIITSLNQACQHVILIGDHQQLRPNPTNYRLAIDYNLNISLFERMVKNKMHCDTLGIQHRMRPEIAELIVPHIYDQLENHKSVQKYENIKGVQGNIFFITHTMKELSQEDTRSHSNNHEAEYVIGLYEYFLKQGYEPSQVTILTLYTGQMFAIRKLLKRKNLDYTRITPVDNYQGEENDIILLSLVRSNEMGSIGFLKISNRVCVALSRAKKGFYVIGNMKQMQEQSHLWNSIIDSLNQKKKVVEALPLACQNHPDTVTMVKWPDDFKKAPEGGCMKHCDFRLDCGHVCVYKCHPIDPEHEEYTCEKPCTRKCKTNGENGHLCQKFCYQSCGVCLAPVTKEIPDCGHKQDVPCHQDPATFSCQAKCKKCCTTNGDDGHPCRKKCSQDCGNCEVIVAKEIPKCCHTQAVPCYQNPENFRCQMACNKPCITNGEDAHKCKKRCSEECGNCEQKVRKEIPSCGHFQLVPCYQNPTTFSCQLPCERKPFSCEHSCPLLCGKECPGKCEKTIAKELPCGHEIQAQCFKKISELKCLKKIERSLLCGHRIQEVCSKDISEYKCDRSVSTELECGHKVTMTCHHKRTGLAKQFKCYVKMEHVCRINGTHRYTAACSDYFGSFFGCKVQCNAKLPCGHTCQGKCGDCLGQHHPPCTALCGRTLPCLHRCKGKCGEPCRPCQETCNVACIHRFCHNTCGQRCNPCYNDCPWSCPHHTCNKRCGEDCDRDPCDEPCPMFLPCGHRCIGFCGEQPCPPVCLYCNGAFLQQQLKGIPFPEQSRFVQVFPCCHVIESNILENWFKKCVVQDKPHVVGPLICPQCTCKVSFCPRFGNMLKKNAKEYGRIQSKLQEKEKEHKRGVEEFQNRLLRTIKLQTEDINEDAANNGMKRNTKEANWFSNPESLVSNLVKIQFSLLNGNSKSDIRTRVEYVLSEVVILYKLYHEGKNINVVLEVLFSLLSGMPLKNTTASSLLKTSVAENLQGLAMHEFSLDKTKISTQPIEGASWVACPAGKCVSFSFMCL